jgi:hypothetical protein
LRTRAPTFSRSSSLTERSRQPEAVSSAIVEARDVIGSCYAARVRLAGRL